MSTNEIKQQLMEGIENIDDKDFLLTIMEMIEHKYVAPPVPILTASQKQRIAQSEHQIEVGECLSDDEVNKLIDEWLKK